jgi:DNA-binding IclR family transcriptional regulator
MGVLYHSMRQSIAPNETERTRDKTGSTAVQSLSRGLRILGQFTAESKSLSLSELSRATGLHKATVHRFVRALESEGYLLYDAATGVYSVGPVWATALYALGSGTAFAQILNTDLRALAETSLEAVTLGVRRGDDVQVVHLLPSTRSFVPLLPPSRIHPLSAAGNVLCQILLAHSSEEVKRRILAVPQTRYTENTVVDPADVRARLERVLADGVAYEREEYQAGTCAVGVPLMWRGRAVAALALVVPVERFTEHTVPTFVEQLRSAARGMEKRVG